MPSPASSRTPSSSSTGGKASRRVGSRLALATLVWISVVAVGMAGLVMQELKPGRDVAHPRDWPDCASVKFDPSRPNLVLFAHPLCPCTRATLSELEELVTRCRGELKVHVLFYLPSGEPESWSQGALWKRAARLPGVEVSVDRGGIAGNLFGAANSGQVLLYNSAGHRVFAGGITGARGHEGENRGLQFVTDLVRGSRAEARDTPVFGCALENESSETASLR